jgi:putative salt-induced outer membrane protein
MKLCTGCYAAALIALAPVLSVWADDAPAPPPPQDVWIGKGQFGFLESTGNSDAKSINGNIDLLRYDGAWKNEIYVGGLYGENAGIVAAERWETRGQTNYTVSGNLFVFGALRYEHDLFDGFEYQESVSGGLGYKFINTDDVKLTAQVGAGYRRLRPEIIDKDANGEVLSRTPLDATSDGIGTLGVDFSYAFNKATVFTNKFLMETGPGNTLINDALALTVKMSTKLALSVGYAVSNNSNPPAPLKKLDTLTTVNLVFSF